MWKTGGVRNLPRRAPHVVGAVVPVILCQLRESFESPPASTRIDGPKELSDRKHRQYARDSLCGAFDLQHSPDRWSVERGAAAYWDEQAVGLVHTKLQRLSAVVGILNRHSQPAQQCLAGRNGSVLLGVNQTGGAGKRGLENLPAGATGASETET